MTLASQLRARLAAASPRERRLLAVAAVVLAAAALSSLSEWLWRERQRLAAAVPASNRRRMRFGCPGGAEATA